MWALLQARTRQSPWKQIQYSTLSLVNKTQTSDKWKIAYGVESLFLVNTGSVLDRVTIVKLQSAYKI